MSDNYEYKSSGTNDQVRIPSCLRLSQSHHSPWPLNPANYSRATTTAPETTATRPPIKTPIITVTTTDRTTTPTRTGLPTTMTGRGTLSTTLRASNAFDRVVAGFDQLDG